MVIYNRLNDIIMLKLINLIVYNEWSYFSIMLPKLIQNVSPNVELNLMTKNIRKLLG